MSTDEPATAALRDWPCTNADHLGLCSDDHVHAAHIPYEGTDCTPDEAVEAVEAVRATAAVHPNSRLRDVQRTLRAYAKSARAEAVAQGDPDSYGAAALRGKAGGYDEAADLIESALRGGRIRRKWRLRNG